MYPDRHDSWIDRMVRQRWIVEEKLTILRAASRRLLHDRASLDRIRAIASQLRIALKIKDELEKQLAESHCTVQFLSPL